MIPLRPGRLVALLILAGLAVMIYLHSSASNPDGHSQYRIPDLHSRFQSTSIRLGRVLERVSQVIDQSIAQYDQESNLSELGIRLSNISPAGYLADLTSSHHQFFSNRHDELLSMAISKMQLLPQPDPAPIEKTIYTTDLATPDTFVEQFNSWTEMNPEWTVRYTGDEEMDEWVEGVFGEDAGVVEEMKWLKRRGVVRADLFRYLVLLVHGGVYTDTDTACVRPIKDWATHPDIRPAHPLIESLPYLLDAANSGAELPEGDEGPGLLVALESDAKHTGQDWRVDTLVRGLQIAQWTILAKKGHPVLLDVLGRALRTAREIRQREQAGETVEVPGVLEWTGPGAFSDAVFRYLLVKYGIHPAELSGKASPVRYGDVVVMQPNAFRSDASEGWQGEHQVVWHGFFGRWKGN